MSFSCVILIQELKLRGNAAQKTQPLEQLACQESLLVNKLLTTCAKLRESITFMHESAGRDGA